MLAPMRRFVREALEAAGVMAGCVGLGLLALVGGAALQGAAYPAGAMARPADDAPTTWLVDGFNVLNVAVLRGDERVGFWRSAARERLLALAGAFDEPGAEVVVVFDGDQTPPDELGEHVAGGRDSAGPRVVFARPADDWLLTRLRQEPDPASVTVVTADRRLADRARHRGAHVLSPSAFVDRCRPAPHS